ncbi:hypothetical protein XM38_044640 [Halomicronema hongdechloris C2206]|uniref:Filament integrity protein n=1 Tax=Halomicronema hongdechloris C2206 TaxID=1641165 RepID=A0A1Z3HTP8_9CYAN|nr:filament integrity protein FraC [Halomicronema hongdechloris]ASC73497.1 hypothetical protein XM38_044640 [Halomicronema hongdechloris C2206]
MPFRELLEVVGVLPLRAIAFQCVCLLVAIALEGAVLRQHLRLGYQTSVQYAATVNLFATSLGWLTFLGLEPLAAAPLQRQIISYVLFDQFYANSMASQLIWMLLAVGILCFFATFFVKLQALEWLMRMLGRLQPADRQSQQLSRRELYQRARQGRRHFLTPSSRRTLAVLQGNALSFVAILLLLSLRRFVL